MPVRIFRLAVALVCALLAGCASMNGLAPETTSRNANTLASAQSLSDTKVDAAAWPSTDWWKAFGDPQLDRLIDEALADSPTLAVAAARMRKALALAQQSQSALSPRLDASASTTRERFPEHGLIPPPFGGTTQTLSDLQLSLSWEIDFWGKNRSAYEAALGAARAAEVDAYAARLALSTNIAQAYVQLQRAYLQLDVAQQTLASRERIAALTRDRNAAGIDSRLEVKQAEAALPATREDIAALEERIALARNAIAALMGAGPDRGLAISRPTATALAHVSLPSSVPAELIGHRPDIVAQRWRVEAASKDIGSQKAAFYPNVNLLAFVGLQSLGSANLLSAASRTLGVAPAVTLPIFDAGRLRAELAGKDADYDVAVGQYNQALANAMREVVDQLVSFRSLDEQRAQQRIAATTTREAYDLALLRYREGLGNYLQVLSAEQPMLAQQGLDADLRARALELSINLVRALGGGYEPTRATALSMTTGSTQ
ncbi:MAG TPA: efflux transporter outer membrane subunit [Casimicrobiaceae bacterium]|nr:efflux transporter outer membrane subunit [Casimicrobiaceae bacterium]